ncbi:hypothetical protein ACP70R_029053 [Stipagrostis hirtigluma subsp. patula]
MAMKLNTGLAIIAALLMHPLSLIATPVHTTTNYTTPDNSSPAGFSFALVTNHTIRRGSDGFLHLQGSLGENMKPRHGDGSSAAANATALGAKTNVAPVNLPHFFVFDFGSGIGRNRYYLRLETTYFLTWIQCKHCNPHARQHGPLFDPVASPTYRRVLSDAAICVEPQFHKIASSCVFRFNKGHEFAEGYVSTDHVTKPGGSAYRGFIFGCAYEAQNFQEDGEGRYAGVAGFGDVVMQLAARGLTRFSYCLWGGAGANRQGFLRFGDDVPHNRRYSTTGILPSLHAHPLESVYYVSLAGLSIGAHRLDGIRPEMFGRRKDGHGGCAIDLGTPMTVMVEEAYRAIEEAVWSDLERHGAERVKLPGFGLCVRATKAVKGQIRLQSLSLRFSEEEAVLVISPAQLFVMMNDKQGQIACLAMTPGNRTVIGAFQQVDTRFVYDVKESKLSFAPESCIRDTTQFV